MQTAAPIAVRNVSKLYGRLEIMRDLDLSFPAGSFTVILGPSGCGKSTLLRLIAGLEALSGGDIVIDGNSVKTVAPKDRGCAMVFQNYALYPHMSVAGNIGYGLKIEGVRKAEREARVAEIAGMLGLGELLRRKPNQLSGGQRQRVAIGRAIARRPRVLLFDEPLSNLDAALRHDMRVELRRLHHEIGATSIFVTHDQAEAMALADRILVLNKGSIEQFDTPERIYGAPKSTFVAKFVGTPPINLFPGTVTGRSIAIGEEAVLDVAPTGASSGRKVLVGIRPEDLAIATGDAPGESCAKGLTMTIGGAENMGAHMVLRGTIAGNPAMISARLTVRPGIGERIALCAPRSAIHLFDAETGARIASAAHETGVGL
jgi:sn-glycerol 3-phosphate transport system ATP-binding protein